jgi:hypothetical protein
MSLDILRTTRLNIQSHIWCRRKISNTLLDYTTAADFIVNPIPESICGESFNMDEMKDLNGDKANFDSNSTLLENIKLATNEGIK